MALQPSDEFLVNRGGVNYRVLYSEITAGIPPTLPAGQTMGFIQATAPVGWTQAIAWNNRGVRLRDTTGGAQGGNVNFNDIWTPTFLQAANLSVSGGGSSTTTIGTAEMASHSHSLRNDARGDSFASGGRPCGNGPSGYSVGGAGGGSAHSHSIQAGSAAIQTTDFALTYVDMLLCISP